MKATDVFFEDITYTVVDTRRNLTTVVRLDVIEESVKYKKIYLSNIVSVHSSTEDGEI